MSHRRTGQQQPEMIPDNKYQQSKNGCVLAGIIERYGLLVGNGPKQCEGLVT